jgi:anti-sigma factor RsiW
MEHGEAHALLELAAIEPDGFARLAAGDTAEAAALAGHLAGCPGCAAEFEHLGRLAAELRSSVRELPSPDLRERTLELVASVGRARPVDKPQGLTYAGSGASGVSLADAAPPIAAVPLASPARGRRRSSRSWMLASAASMVIAVAGVAGWWSASSRLAGEEAAVASLADVTATAARVASQADAQAVELGAEPTGPGPAKGEVVLSPGSREVVVVAEGLAEPAGGMEYRCWVEIAGVRTTIGRMYLYAGLATWAGWSAALDGLRPGARFGVSLVGTDTDAPGEPVLTGEL